MKNSNDTIWDRTSNLPICSTSQYAVSVAYNLDYFCKLYERILDYVSGYAVNHTHFVISAAVLHTNALCAVNKITFLHKVYRKFYRATECEKNITNNYSFRFL